MSGHWKPPNQGFNPPPYTPPSVSYVTQPVTYVPSPVAYVPAPLPVYPPMPQPTYHINNYIYEQPANPVQVINHPPVQHPPPPQPPPVQIDWVSSNPHSAQTLAHRAVVAGKEGWDNSPLWVIRAHHSGDLVPGKFAVRHRQAYIPLAGREVPVHNFEVLCAPSSALRWLPSSHGKVPAGAITAGFTHSGETLYVGRAHHKRSLTPGKVHPSHGCLYISFGGSEVPNKQYEVLCRIVG